MPIEDVDGSIQIRRFVALPLLSILHREIRNYVYRIFLSYDLARMSGLHRSHTSKGRVVRKREGGIGCQW